MQDYSERRPVSSNRPRKQGGLGRYFVLTACICLLVGAGIGLAGGWLLFKPSRQELNALRFATAKGAPPAPEPAAPRPPAPAPSPDPNLSFYKTLPGGKPLLGTGLNPPKPEDPVPAPAGAPAAPPQQTAPRVPAAPQPGAARPAIPPAAAPPEQREPPQQEKVAAKPPPLTAAPAPPPLPSGPEQARKAQPKGKYVVQVASYQSKSEAEAVKERLIDAGLPAYVVEGVLKEKGTMYRVRIGRHMELADAEKLAVRAGKNAIPVLE